MVSRVLWNFCPNHFPGSTREDSSDSSLGQSRWYSLHNKTTTQLFVAAVLCVTKAWTRLVFKIFGTPTTVLQVEGMWVAGGKRKAEEEEKKSDWYVEPLKNFYADAIWRTKRRDDKGQIEAKENDNMRTGRSNSRKDPLNGFPFFHPRSQSGKNEI